MVSVETLQKVGLILLAGVVLVLWLEIKYQILMDKEEEEEDKDEK